MIALIEVFKMKPTALAILIFVTATSTLANKKPSNADCKAYFIVVEQDAITVNLKMLGFNGPQQSWYSKHGGEFPGLCPVNGDATGKRVTLDQASEQYVDSIVGSAPLYEIGWEEHKEFVPDNNGGHYAFQSNGVLSRWDNAKQDFIPVAPIHNTNRTILSSSSTSLLKDGLKAIQSQ
jgi:hypothetical protein